MDIKQLADIYLLVGSGGISVLILVWVLIYLITKINPSLQAIRESNIVHSEILKNSTDAVKEVSRSNDNVASALSLLNHSFNTLIMMFEKHDTRQEDTYRMLVEMKYNVEAVSDLVVEKKDDLRDKEK